VVLDVLAEGLFKLVAVVVAAEVAVLVGRFGAGAGAAIIILTLRPELQIQKKLICIGV
jgi:hypothetical protein